jgi:hypothetical protein
MSVNNWLWSEMVRCYLFKWLVVLWMWMYIWQTRVEQSWSQCKSVAVTPGAQRWHFSLALQRNRLKSLAFLQSLMSVCSCNKIIHMFVYSTRQCCTFLSWSLLSRVGSNYFSFNTDSLCICIGNHKNICKTYFLPTWSKTLLHLVQQLKGIFYLTLSLIFFLSFLVTHL